MIYSDIYGEKEAQTEIVYANIAGAKRGFRVAAAHAYHKPNVWVKSGGATAMVYVVGIQHDGSIVRAEGLHTTDFPMDPRCKDGQVVVKKQSGNKYVSYTNEDWPVVEKVKWIQAEIAGEVRNFGIMATVVGGMPIVWMITNRVGSDSVNFIVGIQHDGSILRAAQLSASGFPLDPRCTNDVVVIKKQIKG